LHARVRAEVGERRWTDRRVTAVCRGIHIAIPVKLGVLH
jgi:hypothetical protein